MSRPNTIGRKASFHFSDGKKVFGEIIWEPAATGDSWIVEDFHEGKKTGCLIYIQQFNYIFFTPEKKEAD